MLEKFVIDFAKSIEICDSSRPQAANARKPEIKYEPGIGPFQEKKLIKMVVHKMKEIDENYQSIDIEVKYPSISRKKCDIVFKGDKNYFIEAKAMRRLRNNGTPEEFIMVDMLSPYEGDGSVLGDIRKLLNSGFDGEKVIMIYGYDYPDWPLQIAIDCFETLAEKFFCKFNAKFQASFSGLVHPYHKEGKIFCWVVDNK